MADVLHVVPCGDLVEHEVPDTEDAEQEACVCGPRTELVQREDAPDGHVVVHHALDGRELTEHG